MGEAVAGAELLRTMSAVARRLAVEPDLERTLAATTRAAVDAVPGAERAGITRATNRQRPRFTSTTPTDQVVSTLDQVQDELQQGPCVAAVREQHLVHIPRMSEEQRWPIFAARAVELGVHSMASFQLYVDDRTFGALNLYAGTPDAFTSDDFLIAEVFATHAAVALTGADRQHQLSTAIASRDVIGQAKGLLMARNNITGAQAFDLLIQSSQENNVKLAALAEWLVQEHEDPGTATLPRRRT